MDPELAEGVRLFNAREFCESHERFEEEWMVEVGPRKWFLKGLVHTAMGFHYVTHADYPKGMSLLRSGMHLLDGFADDFMGMDVAGFRAAAGRCREELERLGPQGAAALDRALYPTITDRPSSG
ncbi:MAG TPA: DUF309 domain-containing protein [Candidatus Methylomirabilis sp.]